MDKILFKKIKVTFRNISFNLITNETNKYSELNVLVTVPYGDPQGLYRNALIAAISILIDQASLSDDIKDIDLDYNSITFSDEG